VDEVVSYFIHLPMKMELIEGSETSAIRTQTPGNYPKENILEIRLIKQMDKLFRDVTMGLSVIGSGRFERAYCLYKQVPSRPTIVRSIITVCSCCWPAQHDTFNITINIEQSLYRSGQALGVPGG